MKSEVLIERFKVISNTSIEFDVCVYQTMIKSVDGSIVRGMKRIVTQEGYSVNRIDDNTFQIVNYPFALMLEVKRV